VGTYIICRIIGLSLSRIGYVELRSLDLVNKAINLTGTVVMGLPIKVQLTEAERNRIHSGEYVLVFVHLLKETDNA
jgi:RNA-binding protein 39